MAKDLEQWEHAEVSSSLKLTTSGQDWVTPAMCVGSAAGMVAQLVGPFNGMQNPHHFAAIPYNPAKNVFDTWRVLACYDYQGGGNLALQYHLNAGVGPWTSLTLPNAPPYFMCGAPITLAGAPAPVTGYEDIFLGGLGAATYIGLRWFDSVGAPTAFTWTLTTWLYHSTHTPF